jgi:threonine synthase
MRYLNGLKCIDCETEYPVDGSLTICPACSQKGIFFGLLDPVYDYDGIARRIDKDVLTRRRPGLWKYVEFMPVRNEPGIVTMGEGGAPLVKGGNLAEELEMDNLYFKTEGVNPTYSFKDLPNSLVVTKVHQEGVKTVNLMSDGNNGAAAAAYCARAGIENYTFIPADAIPEKVAQIQIYGGKIIMVAGNTLEAGLLSLEASARYGWVNISQIKIGNPYASEAHKSISYEICEDLGWKAPDWVLTPVASGDSLGAQWKGYKEFHAMGFIPNRPRMVAVQGRGADPVVQAFEQGKAWHEIEAFDPVTVCDGLAAGAIPGSWSLRSIEESGGQAVSVTDDETLRAQLDLAKKEGIFVEPSSVVPLVALRKLLTAGAIKKSDTVVCVLSGSGLKVMSVAKRSLQAPVPIPPEIGAVDDLLKAWGK